MGGICEAFRWFIGGYVHHHKFYETFGILLGAYWEAYKTIQLHLGTSMKLLGQFQQGYGKNSTAEIPTVTAPRHAFGSSEAVHTIKASFESHKLNLQRRISPIHIGASGVSPAISLVF